MKFKKMTPRCLIGFTLSGLLLLLSPAVFSATSKSILHHLSIDGSEREYRIYAPASQKNEKLPLMIVLHGGLGNAEEMEATTGMNDIAEKEKFIVAYPNGTGGRFLRNRRTWNAGTCCGPAEKNKIDDVKFIDSMLTAIEKNYPVNKKKVYIAGLSNGAMMAYRLACEIPDKIAAIIPVAGTLNTKRPCEGVNQVAILHVHGKEDKHVPVNGGMGPKGITKVSYRSVDESLNRMMKSRQCNKPQQKNLDNQLIETNYQCKNGAPVSSILIVKGEHTWPGSLGKRHKESDNNNFITSRKAWEFARQFETPSQ
ncbi:MAG: alpha/beta hydrolase-fold protein [Gammaproteobacteria bacterium]|nr:alpha/beta hydrolase-fold protein [Gammaproteobacteria bacterium]